MLEYNYFYPCLAEGISFGMAFLRTFQYVGSGYFDKDTKGWYYGLTFNGDPFIVPQPEITSELTENSENQVAESMSMINYPNPFNQATTITYTLPQTTAAQLIIYDIQGREVRRFICGVQFAGKHKVQWDGRDTHRNNIASGVYFYRLAVNSDQWKFLNSGKMIVLK